MPGFGGGYTAFSTVFVLILILILSVFVLTIVKGISTYANNNAAEIMSVNCKVVGKRSDVWGGSGDSSASTRYYITFEFEDASRLELNVKAKQYGYIIEGDSGTLNYQGTRFNTFTRAL